MIFLESNEISNFKWFSIIYNDNFLKNKILFWGGSLHKWYNKMEYGHINFRIIIFGLKLLY